MAEGTTEGLKNWLGGEKTARPATAGAHDPLGKDQNDPNNPGVDPHQYEPKPGDNNNRTDAAAPKGPVNIGVKGAAPDDAADPGDAGREMPQATGRGARDSSSLPQD